MYHDVKTRIKFTTPPVDHRLREPYPQINVDGSGWGKSYRNNEETPVDDSLQPAETNKYNRYCKGITIDVYDVLKTFNVTCPAMQHAIKKMLCTGIRGHKNYIEDAKEAIKSIERSIELYTEDRLT